MPIGNAPRVSPLSVGVGVFVTPRLAVLARLAGTTYSQRGSYNGESHLWTYAFYGVSVQYWIDEVWFLEGGLGLGHNGRDGFLVPLRSTQYGVSFSARAGWVFATHGSHSFSATLELIPSVYRETQEYVGVKSLGTVLAVQWQLF